MGECIYSYPWGPAFEGSGFFIEIMSVFSSRSPLQNPLGNFGSSSSVSLDHQCMLFTALICMHLTARETDSIASVCSARAYHESIECSLFLHLCLLPPIELQ